jgi:hypothetical protein
MKPESFKLFAELKGINLHKDDISFIKRFLGFIAYQERRKILERYAEEWLKGMAQTDIVYAKQNIGRFRANTWLRELVENDRQS